jgi:hypothetical protein
MPYGEIRVDTITFTNAGVDKSITVSGLFASTSGNLTVTGTVSGTTFTGTTANFTSGNVTTFSGGTCTITSGVFASGTATNPSISFIADSNTGFYSPGADQVAISTNGTGRLFVDAGGNIGVGTSSPFSSNGTNLHVLSTGTARLWLQSTAASTGRQFYLESLSTGGLTFSDGTAGQERMRLDANGRLLVGQTTTGLQAARSMAWQGSGEGTLYLSHSTSDGNGDPFIKFGYNAGEIGSLRQAGLTGVGLFSADYLNFGSSNTERLRIDSSGRLLVGTSTARNNFYNITGTGPSFQIEGADNNPSSMSLVCNFNGNTNGPALIFGKSNSTALGSNTLTVNGNNLGRILFSGNDGTEFVNAAEINAEVDGTPGANDMPGRLVFSTTADGASSPTERMRIASNGAVGVGDTSPASNALRASFKGPVSATESALPVVSIARTNNSAGGSGVPETGLDVQIPNTFNSAGEVKGINVFARHNIGTSATYGIFAEAGGNPSNGNIYSGYFKVTQPDTNGAAVNYAVYAQANSTIGASSIGFSIGVTSETSNYVNNQNFRAVSLYTGANTQTVLSIIRNSSAIGSITTSTTATAYNTSSDYRLKENVIPLTGATNRINQLQVHRFNFIADPDTTVDGFIAHEAQAVVPECVTGEKDAVDEDGNPKYQGIDQSKLVPLLTAALQEAIAKIETLEAKVAALEGN